MRKLTDHIVSGDQAVQLEIQVNDQPGAGGANHAYAIYGINAINNPSNALGYPYDRLDTVLPILFQNGPIKEIGVNGVTQEALLAIVIDRLRSFQEGPYPSEDNLEAHNCCVQALAALQRRTLKRIARGVEGTTQA